MQQIQYGRRPLNPLTPLKTQAASCFLSQTGLRCHSNMLWRSTYWDTAGWHVTVLAVRVFSPCSHTNILHSESPQHTAVYRAPRFAFVRARILYSPMCAGPCACSRNATQRTLLSDKSKCCASACLFLVSQFGRFTEAVWSYPLTCHCASPLSFFTINTNCCGLLSEHAKRKFWICHQCFWFCHTHLYLQSLFEVCFTSRGKK